MIKKHSSVMKRLDDEFPWDKKTVGIFFLGVGFILFLLNITSILRFIDVQSVSVPLFEYYMSTLSSLFLMAYSLYNIYSKD